jgi:hypothetical protein
VFLRILDSPPLTNVAGDLLKVFFVILFLSFWYVENTDFGFSIFANIFFVLLTLFFLRFICTFCNVERANLVFRKSLKNAEMFLVLLAFS